MHADAKEAIRERRAKLSLEKQSLLQKLLDGELHSTEPDTSQHESLPTIVPAPDDRYQPFPLTEVQQAYWIGRGGMIELGNVGTHAYLEHEFDNLDLDRFESAWQRLIEQHDMMRAIIRPDGQQQILEQVPPYQISVLDLRGEDPEAVATQLEAIRQEMSHQVLPSDQWPLFDIRASLLDNQRIRIHLSFDLLIGDNSSIQILLQELTQLYHDPDLPLPPLEISFRDYVLAEMTLQESELYQRSLEYWRNRLPTLPPAPELPLAKPSDSLMHPQFAHREAGLEPEMWNRLKTRSAQAGLTPSAVLLTAFAEVMAAWSKSPSFTINLTLFNRLPLHPQVDNIVGDFTSLTLLSVDSSGQEKFGIRARRVQEQLWQDMDHRYVGGVHVMRELMKVQEGLPRAIMPIVFTSTLVLASPDHETSLPSGPGTSKDKALFNLENRVFQITQTPQVWLDHQVNEQDGALFFSWDAVEDLFPERFWDDVFNAYCHLLHRLTDEEAAWQETRGQLVPVPAAQLEQQAAANATGAPVPTELLHTLFVTQVSERPAQAAVVTAHRTLSYDDLYRRANQIGHWLRDGGARSNELVAVVMEKGWEQVPAVLGVLQSGAAYLPIAADLPQERIDYLLVNGEVELVLTQSWVEEELTWPEHIQRLCIDRDLDGLDDQPLESIQRQEDLAYVIYTSGSTGQPKGVVIDHRGAVNTILDVNQRFEVGPDDRVLALSSLGFDLSVYDIFGTLAAGGTIVIPNAANRRDPAHWLALMTQERVTVWNSVPALMEMLVEYVEGCSEQLPDSLRLILMSGDWIPVTLPDRMRALGEDIQVISMGGATEASIWSIMYPIEEVDPEWKSIPYGKPMTNQHFYVLDEALEPRPMWVPGQLYIGGIGLAKGYWRDEEKTQASFIHHPRTGERLYRTGDLGRYLPGGNIEFLGREDFQVKIRGHRIELGEIEAALLQHPAVRAGAVAAVDMPRGDRQLVAYVVPDSESVPASTEQQALFDDQSLSHDYEPQHLEGVILDSLERLKFKLAHPGLRRSDGRPRVQFVKHEPDETLIRTYVARRSYREFQTQPIPFERFGQLLSCLSQVELDGAPLPKYQYGSAGSLYPVQTYVYVKPNRVSGVVGGAYYYHPAEHQLVLLSADAYIDPKLYGPGNQAVFEVSAFALFFVGRLGAITPMYGEWARGFCMLEAGLMTQLLEMSASAHQIGLCQIGGFDFEPIRRWFDLGEDHVYLHSLLGGPITVNQTGVRAFIEGLSEIRSLVGLVQQDFGGGDGSVSGHFVPTSTPLQPQPERPGSDGVVVRELRSFLHGKLPEYMVPSVFMVLDALPLTSSGKVDRRALPDLDATGPEPEKPFVAPETEFERTIAAVWQEVLQAEKVGIYDNFFDLGGNSVHIVRVHSELREILGEDVSIVKMFEYPTIHSLINYMHQEQDEGSTLQQSQDRAQTRRVLRQQRRQARSRSAER